MAPLYEEVCKDLSWTVNESLLQQMKNANEEQLKKLDVAIEDAEKNLGEMEVREAFLNKAEYLSRIGSKVRINEFEIYKLILLLDNNNKNFLIWNKFDFLRFSCIFSE